MLPGDVVVAEEEAVLFFPSHIAADVLEQATKTVHKEKFERKVVRQKTHRFRDVYPLNDELLREFEKEQEASHGRSDQ